MDWLGDVGKPIETSRTLDGLGDKYSADTNDRGLTIGANLFRNSDDEAEAAADPLSAAGNTSGGLLDMRTRARGRSDELGV